jgi:hypothetical protein
VWITTTQSFGAAPLACQWLKAILLRVQMQENDIGHGRHARSDAREPDPLVPQSYQDMRRVPGVPQPRNAGLHTPLWYTQCKRSASLERQRLLTYTSKKTSKLRRHLISTRQLALSRCISRHHSVGALSDKVKTSLHKKG